MTKIGYGWGGSTRAAPEDFLVPARSKHNSSVASPIDPLRKDFKYVVRPPPPYCRRGPWMAEPDSSESAVPVAQNIVEIGMQGAGAIRFKDSESAMHGLYGNVWGGLV